MSKSKIEWTEESWNPLTGCSKISDGCKHCYAERMAIRLHAMGSANYKNAFKLTMHHQMISRPLSWNKPRVIFVNSMSDLFHEDVPFSFIQKVFETMNQAKWHRFQILTKRAKRLHELAPHLVWTDNIWMGVTVESEKYTSRIEYLREIPAKIRFLSCEPLLSPLPNLNLFNIHWIIVGGESGPFARPIEKEWIMGIRDQCITQNIPFFFKQWGGFNKKQNGRLLDGKLWEQEPEENIVGRQYVFA